MNTDSRDKLSIDKLLTQGEFVCRLRAFQLPLFTRVDYLNRFSIRRNLRVCTSLTPHPSQHSQAIDPSLVQNGQLTNMSHLVRTQSKFWSRR